MLRPALATSKSAGPDCWVIRMTYQRSNVAARGLYESLGFVPAGSVAAEGEDEEEILVEISPAAARRAAAEGAAGATGAAEGGPQGGPPVEPSEG